jgi:hypothetical protein
LSEEQQSKINEITNFLTGKASSSYSNGKTESKPSSGDFDFEDTFSSTTSSVTDEEEDDFFADM